LLIIPHLAQVGGCLPSILQSSRHVAELAELSEELYLKNLGHFELLSILIPEILDALFSS